MNSFEDQGRSKILNKRVIRSDELFQGEREIIIIHDDDYYRLFITKSKKLVLNK